MKHGLKIILVVFLIMLNLVSFVDAESFELRNKEFVKEETVAKNLWQQVPLRSKKQEALGLSGGEGMQMIWGISYAPSNPNIVYLVSDTSQVWKSTDGGKSWQMKHKGFLANGGISLAVDPINEDIVFVAGSVHEAGVSDDFADGIYRTQDGGESWELVRQTPFYRMEEKKGGTNFDFVNGTVYAGTHGEGLLKSTDGGNTWQSLNILRQQRILDVKAYPKDKKVLYIASERGFFKVTDNGIKARIRRFGAGLPVFPRAIQVHPANPNIIYVSAGQFGVYKSLDGGRIFRACNKGLETALFDNDHKATYLAMSPVNPDHLYVSFLMLGGSQPFYTRDGCNFWNEPIKVDEGDLIFDVNFSPGGEFWSSPIAPSFVDDNVAITSGNGNHVEQTINGGETWTYSGDGYTGGRVAKFSWDPNNPDRFVLFLTDFGMELTKDGGSTFEHLHSNEDSVRIGIIGALDPTPGSDRIVAAFGDNDLQDLALSTDEGKTWEIIGNTEDEHTFIEFHPQNRDVVYAGQYRSTDRGSSWKKIDKKIVAIFPGDGNVVYAIKTGNDGTTLFKSTDKGNTWTEPYDVIDSIDVKDISVDPNDPDRLYVATLWSGVFIWDGDNWVQKTEKDGLELDRFESLSFGHIAIDHKQPNVIYAGRWLGFRGHANGIFRSVDSGETWQNITFNLGPEFNIDGISVNPHDSYAYIASSHGTWKLPPP